MRFWVVKGLRQLRNRVASKINGESRARIAWKVGVCLLFLPN